MITFDRVDPRAAAQPGDLPFDYGVTLPLVQVASCCVQSGLYLMWGQFAMLMQMMAEAGLVLQTTSSAMQ